ncbi:MAG: efflux RND transporter periplasmic adaptor subunit [Candidatus Omnitrophica bacterium]|nr:efflux RND transporter periplasmic adaptor subunit [Candidatus Omnitrophota bacterium]
MRKRICLFAAFVLLSGFTAVMFMPPCFAADAAAKQSKGKYHCPMHPDFVSDKKGTCGICGMDLVKSDDDEPEAQPSPAVEKSGHKILYYRNPMNPAVTSATPTKDSMGMDYVPVYEEEKGAAPGVSINTSKQQLIGVKKGLVQKRALSVGIITVGKVAYDPDLYVAQEEYIQAVKTAAATSQSALVSIREQSAGLLVSAERKLLLMGMSKTEVEALKSSGAAQDSLYFPGNSGKAWIYITVYEYELGLVKEGQDVLIDAVAFPGEIFKGKVTAITPVLSAESRSVRVRAEVDDKAGKLKPEMFVNATIAVDLGEKLSIPEEAVMDSGTRKIVYVVKDNRFAAREVTLGPKAAAAAKRAERGGSDVPAPVRPAGEFYEVISGLNEGEEVVTSGNFLIDAESKLKGAL